MRTGRGNQARTRGILLLETVVYAGLACMIAMLGFVLLCQGIFQTRQLTRNSEEIIRSLNAGERWRTDIRSATNNVCLQVYPDRQELIIPGGAGEVAYGFWDDAVWRKDAGSGDWKTLVPQVQNCEMICETDSGITCWRWELQLIPQHKRVRLIPLFTFRAVPAYQPGNP